MLHRNKTAFFRISPPDFNIVKKDFYRMKGRVLIMKGCVYIIMSIPLSVDRRGHSLHLLEYSRHRGEVGKAHTIGYIAEWKRTVGE